jgi:hypothetical protein
MECMVGHKRVFTESGKIHPLARWIRNDFFPRSVHMFLDALAKQKPRIINLLKVGQNHIFCPEKVKSWEQGTRHVTWVKLRTPCHLDKELPEKFSSQQGLDPRHSCVMAQKDAST